MSEIYIYGDINENSALNFNKFVRKNVRGSHDKEFTIYINSTGGEYGSACSIIDTICGLRQSGTKVITIVDGNAYSAACFIFCFGDLRAVHTHSSLMLHPVYYDTGEISVCEIKAGADFSDKHYRDLLKEIVTNCNLEITAEQLYDKLRHGWWFDGREALEYGIANKRAI